MMFNFREWDQFLKIIVTHQNFLQLGNWFIEIF